MDRDDFSVEFKAIVIILVIMFTLTSFGIWIGRQYTKRMFKNGLYSITYEVTYKKINDTTYIPNDTIRYIKYK